MHPDTNPIQFDNPEVAGAFASYHTAIRNELLALRRIILETASETRV